MRAALNAAAPHIRDADRELLIEAADALWECGKAALTVKPTLDTPTRAPRSGHPGRGGWNVPGDGYTTCG
jgi:hypothetical protein